MKKILSILLAIIIACGTMTLGFTTVFAAEDVESLSIGASSGTTGDCTWSLTDHGLLVIEGEGKMEDYGIFTDCAPWGTDIKNVIIENGVTNIGTNAFYSCSNIERVTFPKTLTTIGNGAFCGCSSIKSISLARTGLTTIESQAFGSCDSLEEIHFPDSVTKIGDRAFLYCSSLKLIKLPMGLTGIEEFTFSSCESLKYMSIPDSVTSIDNYAFSDCTSLESVHIPYGNLEHLGLGVFSGCTNLKSIYFNTGIEIPEKVNQIYGLTFENCAGIEQVHFHDAVTAIYYDAFVGCTSLKSVSIPDSMTHIDKYALGYIRDENGNYHKIEDFTIYGYTGNIAEYYAKQYGFNFVSLGESENKPFPVTIRREDGNLTLTEDGTATVSGLGVFGHDDDVFGNQDTLYRDYTKKVVVEEGITDLCRYSFGNYENVEEISLPNTLKRIGSSSFYGCPNVKSVIIPDSVSTIGDKALGFFTDSNWNTVTVDDFTIYGYTGNAAELYAKENGFNFVSIGESQNPATPDKTMKIGDSNGDGFVDIFDAVEIQKFAAEQTAMTDVQKEFADVNNDGFVDVLDAVTIQKYAAGKITEFTKAD